MDFQQLNRIIDESESIVFFGGAGVSTESGIPDFRSSGGLFETENIGKFTPEEILSHDFFMSHTKEFYRFYLRHMIYKEATPNKTHYALAELERLGKLKAVITQNIDGLHQLAGSKNVLELHGSVHRNFCMQCNKFFDLDYIMNYKHDVPLCDQCDGIVKPDVVLYQEGLDLNVLNKSKQHIAECDVLIVGGTSLQVYPAAGLIQYYNGDKMILINQSPTKYDSFANYVISDRIGKVMQNLLPENGVNK